MSSFIISILLALNIFQVPGFSGAGLTEKELFEKLSGPDGARILENYPELKNQPATMFDQTDRVMLKPATTFDDTDGVRQGKPATTFDDTDGVRRGKPATTFDDTDGVRERKPDTIFDQTDGN